MRFEWDENKNEANKRKHGVSFELAKLIFDDPCHLLVFDHFESGEERWHAIGMVANAAVVLTVIHTYRGEEEEIVRIISARRATKDEEDEYAECM